MKFALLGTDAMTLELARAVAASGQQLTAVFQPAAGHLAQLRTWAPGIRQVETWEGLLADGVANVMIVARGERDDRVEPLRLFFQAGIPVMVSHPVVQSMLDYYELDMNREDGGGVVLPLLPWCWHPAIDQLCQMMASDPLPPQASSLTPQASPLTPQASLGRIEQIVFDRQMPDRTKQQVLDYFARDVGLARLLAGELTKVGAMATTGTDADYSALGIQMSGPGGIVVRWSVRPVEQAPGVRVTVVGQAGSAVLSAHDDHDDWLLELRAEGKSQQWEFADWDAAEAALARLAEALETGSVQPDWLEAARDMELTDAVQRSVQKGRTIDIHYEEHTEQGTFKGMMAAGGCALLIAALVLLVVATTAVNWRVPLAEYWPYVLVAILAAFLLLQSLKLAFPGDRAPPGESRPHERS